MMAARERPAARPASADAERELVEVALEVRPAYVHLLGSRVVRAGRDEDPADDGVWAVTCFVTRTGFRRRGVSGALAGAAVGFAWERGACAIEGLPDDHAARTGRSPGASSTSAAAASSLTPGSPKSADPNAGGS